ncbi:MAG: hypothetical protein V4532_06095 [Pseudomonadota bacterium]
MSKEMDDLEAAVVKIKGAKDSAVALINGAAAFIKANAADPVKLKAFAEELTTDATALADAVVANPLPPTP